MKPLGFSSRDKIREEKGTHPEAGRPAECTCDSSGWKRTNPEIGWWYRKVEKGWHLRKIEGRVDGLVEDMKEKKRHKRTPRPKACVAGRMFVALLAREDLGERNAAYCR